MIGPGVNWEIVARSFKMRWKLMSVFDSAVGIYSPPFCVRAVGQALRDFGQQAKDTQSRISQSPADFTLFELGEFDDERGEFHCLAAPRRLLTGVEAVSVKD